MFRIFKCSIITSITTLFCLFLPGFGLTIALAELPSTALADEQGNRYISIEQAQSEISIDGFLDDQEWEKAIFQKHFIQREPVYGKEASEETQIALLKDEDNLYLGIKCYDSSSSDIIANEMRRDAGRGGLFRVSQAGVLRGLSNLQSGRTIDFLPYLMGGLSKNIEIDSTYSQVKEIGLDATIAITSNINLKLSWNTDFAQVESDQERVNLTRFSLYFPEKREFFLDGAEIFNFGGAGMGGRRQGGGGSTTLNLFYSRRIGILEGHQQPIMGGMKLLGKVGSYQFGFLNMLTEDFEAIEEDEDTE